MAIEKRDIVFRQFEHCIDFDGLYSFEKILRKEGSADVSGGRTLGIWDDWVDIILMYYSVGLSHPGYILWEAGFAVGGIHDTYLTGDRLTTV